MRNILLLILIILSSCGARKSDVNIQNSSGSENIETTQQSSIKIDNKGILIQNHTITDLGYGFSIEPINGQNSFFTLKSGNDSIQVQTNAKINFNKNNKTEDKKTIYEYVTKTSYKTYTRYKSNITYKSYIKNKSTEKDAYPWFLWFIFGMFIMFILTQLITKNNLVSLWNRINNKKNES